MSDHTPTPWRAFDWRVVAGLGKGIIVADGLAGWDVSFYQAAVNAAHIVKCVNAWDDANALRARLAELHEDEAEPLFPLTEAVQRVNIHAELQSALQGLLSQVDRDTPVWDLLPDETAAAIERARAVLAVTPVKS